MNKLRQVQRRYRRQDGLVLAAGTVTVNATDDGIRGTDYTVLLDGAYTVTAGGDG